MGTVTLILSVKTFIYAYNFLKNKNDKKNISQISKHTTIKL